MRVLVACEFSGIVRDAFKARGHDAWSCDLLDTESAGPHIVGDVRSVLADGWDLLIAHPPCTYPCVSDLHWNGRRTGRWEKTNAAVQFVRDLLNAPIARIALENPVGIISTRIRRPDQIIQPYNFGDDASKGTCLWLKNLPRLNGTQYVEPRMVNGRPRWSNQTDSGQNKLAPSESRSADRARTYPGIAAAMAEQWGNPESFVLQTELFYPPPLHGDLSDVQIRHKRRRTMPQNRLVATTPEGRASPPQRVQAGRSHARPTERFR